MQKRQRQPTKRSTPASRRRFLTLAAAATGGGALLGNAKPAPAETQETGRRRLYRESDHIKRYYELAR